MGRRCTHGDRVPVLEGQSTWFHEVHICCKLCMLLMGFFLHSFNDKDMHRYLGGCDCELFPSVQLEQGNHDVA